MPQVELAGRAVAREYTFPHGWRGHHPANCITGVAPVASAIIVSMRTYLKILLLCLLVAGLAIATPASAMPYTSFPGFDDGFNRVMQQPAFYTDYMRSHMEGRQKMVLKGLIAKNGDKMRIDMDSREMAGDEDMGGMDFMLYTGIITKPTSLPIMLIHIPEKYMIGEESDTEPLEGIAEPGRPAKPAKEDPPIVTKEKIGEEKFDNHACIIFKITVTYKNGDKLTGRVWEATDYGDVKPYLKIVVDAPEGTVTVELHNLKISKPSDNWFEIPEGYQKIDSYMELFPAEMMTPSAYGEG